MADALSKAARSALMARIRGDDLGPETRLRAALAAAGTPFRANAAELPGKPDLLLGRLAVFVHGCYWHCCPLHWRLPKTGAAGWAEKFSRNRRRDARVRRKLRALGFLTMVVWEHDLKTETRAAQAAARINRRKDRDK